MATTRERCAIFAAMASMANAVADDPTVYPVEEDVGEHELRTYILEVLRPLLAHFLAKSGARAHVGSDQFIYWEEHTPTRCVAPDIYVLPGVSQQMAIDVWKVWEKHVVPSFALEVVTSDHRKDYEDTPKRYDELGVQELVVFDPFCDPNRVAFQVFRRVEGELKRVERTAGDRVQCQSLGCWLRVIGEGSDARLRVALDPDGDALVPTAEEREQSERKAKERERLAKEAALARIAELEAELAKR